MAESLIELHYLPGIAYFCAIGSSATVRIEKHEHFVKQSYRNRCYINTEHGRDALIVPLTGKHGKVPITDVRIDHSQKWVNNHWRSIRSAYGKAPFFEYYGADLERVLFHRHVFLYEMNIELLTMCLRWLRLDVTIVESLSFEPTPPTGVTDLRSAIAAKNKGNAISVYRPVAYHQVFGNAFVENLSIIDLVFCCGPEAGKVLKASSAGSEQLRN